MSKVTMPEPALSQVRFKGFACGWLPWMGWEWRNLMGGEKQERHLITTEQAEAYAAAKVSEALKEAAWIVDLATQSHHVECWGNLESLATRIRALIPSTPA
ncbi:hypothetical protein CLH39_08525 [Alcaligenes faecalis]|uniref:hypothetical protein n=1 Tax=Alcaligenes faecalis TaxID=511 RepID=UPI0019314234|nr:hypothetical protein [Alcaligenes faecalis]QRF90268.1 hypothetical protein CLH39_08525 [Alcaligenes faecalis]